MKVSGILSADHGAVPGAIAALERAGYDTACAAEINNDPFLPLAIAAQHSERIALTTAISVAFARSPMTLAYTAWDLQQYSGGRFTLGLGSQIKPHITRRFSMPWSQPAARMREFVLALRAIWHSWETGEPLAFAGEFYRHDLMTPMFTPGKKEYGAPGVNVAAVGPRMTEVAAEVADGVIAHGFTTVEYLRQVTLPAVARGLAKSGRQRAQFNVIAPVMVVTGADEQAFARSRDAVRAQLGFYASTPAYRPVLELHGWGELQAQAHRMTREGDWAALGEVITDEVLHAFAVVAEDIDSVPALLQQRYGALVDTWMCTVATGDPDRQRALLDAVRGPS